MASPCYLFILQQPRDGGGATRQLPLLSRLFWASCISLLVELGQLWPGLNLEAGQRAPVRVSGLGQGEECAGSLCTPPTTNSSGASAGAVTRPVAAQQAYGLPCFTRCCPCSLCA